jgi:hypothetical protein
MKNFNTFIIIWVILIFSESVFSQDVKTTNDPLFLKKVQGTWIYNKPGDRWWYKVVISGNNITTYNAKPNKGRWNDEREGRNEIIHLEITRCYKVTKQGWSDYDGKPYTKSYSIIETSRIDRDNHIGPYFSMSNGSLERYGDTSQELSKNAYEYDPVIYRKVPANFNPWQ